MADPAWADDGSDGSWGSAEPEPRRLIAGSNGPERVPYRKDPDEPRWFEPLHVRAPGVERGRMAALVAAGADLLMAPTWLTHRRALLPVGETRRAGAWTAAAVRVAREAVELGLEERETAVARADEAAEPDTPPADPARERPPVLVAGVLPALDDAPEPGVGRLLPRDVSSERDHRAQAGLLAEAGVDLILVTGHASVSGARVAVDAAVTMGVPAWAAAPVGPVGRGSGLASGEAVGTWAEGMVHAGASGVLLMPSAGVDVAAVLAEVAAAGVQAVRIGVLATIGADTHPDRLDAAVERWTEAGAWHAGIADGATVDEIATVRAALDRVDRARLAARAASQGRWAALLEDAARRAPGGRAAWIGGRSRDAAALPPNFDWIVVSADAAHTLPEGVLALVVAPAGGDVAVLATLVAPGGILLTSVLDPGSLAGAGLQIVAVGHDRSQGAVVARREP